jgi:hypothetical protein
VATVDGETVRFESAVHFVDDGGPGSFNSQFLDE